MTGDAGLVGFLAGFDIAFYCYRRFRHIQGCNIGHDILHSLLVRQCQRHRPHLRSKRILRVRATNSGTEVIHLPEHIPEILAGIRRGIQCRNAFGTLAVAGHAKDKEFLSLYRVADGVRRGAG